jgi:hypothetical protein
MDGGESGRFGENTKPLEVSQLKGKLHFGSGSCVGRDETAGECDRLSQHRPCVACHPLGAPPEKNHCHDNERERKESRTKKNQENEKLT